MTSTCATCKLFGSEMPLSSVAFCVDVAMKGGHEDCVGLAKLAPVLSRT